jgi:hypothetical protein
VCGVGGEVVRVWVYLGSLPYSRGLRYGAGSGGAGSRAGCQGSGGGVGWGVVSLLYIYVCVCVGGEVVVHEIFGKSMH